MSTAGTLDILEQVDRSASEFEHAWQQGDRPRIADYLAAQTDVVRGKLLRELVMVDLSYRRKQGEDAKLEDYLGDYPELLQADGALPAELVLAARELRARQATASGRWAVGSGQPITAANCRCPLPLTVRCPDCGECVPVRRD